MSDLGSGLDLSMLGIPEDVKTEQVNVDDMDMQVDFNNFKEVDTIADLKPTKKEVKEVLEEVPASTKEKPSLEILEEDEEEEDATEASEPADEVSVVYKSWADTWRDKGFIEFDDKDFEAAEDKEEFIYAKYDEKFKNEIDAYKESVHPYIKQLMDLDDEGIDLTKVIRHDRTIQSYEKITQDTLDESTEMQRNLVVDFMVKSGQYTKEEAETEVQDLEDSGLLHKKAEKALPKLIEYEKKQKDFYIQQQREQEKQEVEKFNKWVKDQTTYVNSMDSIIPGHKLSEKDKKQILDNYTKVDREGKTALQRSIEKDPVKFNALITYFATIKNWDFSDIKTKATTDATRELKKTVNSYRDDNKSGIGKVDINVLRKVFSKR